MPGPTRPEINRVASAGRLRNLNAPPHVVGQDPEPKPGGGEVRLQVADGILHAVDDRVVPKIRPAVVHVEHREVDDLWIRGRKVTVALDARVLASALLRRGWAIREADVGPELHAMLTIERHDLRPPAVRRRTTGSARRPT